MIIIILIGDWPMLTFTERASRIDRLTAQILLHIQAQKYVEAKKDLEDIRVHTIKMEMQIDEFLSMRKQGQLGRM